MKIGIYKITSPTNRIYIGQSINIDRRLRLYKKLDCKGQIKIYNSLLKYGVDNHKFEVIHICNKQDLNDLEIHYIKLFKCCSIGLNISPGGHLVSLDSRIKQQKTLKARYAKGDLINNQKGKKNPSISLLNSKKIGKLNPNSFKCQDITTGKIYDSLKCAWKDLYINTYNYKTFLSYIRKDRYNPSFIQKIIKL